jgi:hypothetical protein
MITHYAAVAARHAHPPARHIGAVVAYVADTRTEARHVLKAHLPRWLGPGLAGYIPVDGRPHKDWPGRFISPERPAEGFPGRWMDSYRERWDLIVHTERYAHRPVTRGGDRCTGAIVSC